MMKTIDEREMQKATKEKQTKTERSSSERATAKWFCCVFKLGFIQLICKASLNFKPNLQLLLSIILKQTEWYESKDVAVECRCLKIWYFLSFLICSSILVLKWRQLLHIWLELQLAQMNLFTRKDFKLLGIGLLCEK